jgi:hypothetical protein
MSAEELEVVIGPDGELQVLTRGIKGKKCMDYIRQLAQALGRVKESRPTEEYYEAEVVAEGDIEQHQWVRR